MSDFSTVHAAIDRLTSSISDEISRIAKRLSDALAGSTCPDQSAELGSIVSQLDSLSDKIDAVEAESVASGTPAVISSDPSPVV